MEPPSDFKEWLALLNLHAVEYIVVGAYALAFHGAPRNTGDIDIYIRPTHENALKILSALTDFGFGSLGISTTDFEQPGQVVQLGTPPVRIDLLTSISGVSWDEANAGKVPAKYGDVPVHYLGLAQYTANKRAIGRAKDLADLEAIEAL
jgi:hypothetical protein